MSAAEQTAVPSYAYADYLRRTRWFSGKGREYAVADVERIAEMPAVDDLPTVSVDLVTVRYAAGDVEVFQVPLAHYGEAVDRLQHAQVHTDGVTWYFDALHDRLAMEVYLRGFYRAFPETSETGRAEVGGLTFHRLPGYDLDVSTHSTLFGGEQSNSSVAFGDDSLMKLFRKVTEGTNPDIEIHAALTEAGSEHVAALYGWVTHEGYQLGMLQQFLRTASDGWDLAQASVRNLFAEADLHADEVGGDFDGEAERLGVAVAEVHEALRARFGESTVDSADVAGAMTTRLQAARADVPALDGDAARVDAVFDALRTLPSVPAQRVHGDLHLGQTLRTVIGWKLVDFEGEPAKPLAERMLPDSPWRDVAGMLRSFDYAAQAVVRDQPMTMDDEGHPTQQDFRAEEWTNRNSVAFLRGYTGGRTLEPEERLLVAAYEADKAVYEAVYEARNRPTWLGIPLAGLARIGAPS